MDLGAASKLGLARAQVLLTAELIDHKMYPKAENTYDVQHLDVLLFAS